MSLETKIHHQRKELEILNNRCQSLTNKIKLINEVDYYKYKLRSISTSIPYKKIIGDKRFIRDIESIFNRPFNECLEYYKQLLAERNDLVHNHTKRNWISSKDSNIKRSLDDLLTNQYL